MERRPDAPLVIVCANLAWNLVNFRSGLIKGLIEAGYRVLAAAPADPDMEARLRALGADFTAVPIDAMGLAPHRDIATFLAFRRLIAQHRPAAWLSWTIKPNVYGSLAAGLAGVPAFPNVSGLGTAFIRRNVLTVIAQQLYRTGFRKAPTVFFQNRDDPALFLQNRLVRPEQIAILPGSGIDTAAWAPASSERPPPRTFLMLARVVADKGVREYVEAARRVRARWPDARFRLMGALGAANRTAIPEAEVRGWIAEGAIEYAEPVDDVRPEIAAADFVVLPSYREGLSRVLLEAAAMARPIVTTDVTGCRDIVREGENGFLCAPRDAAALAAALEQAAATGDADWLRMGQAGRARVLAEFSQEMVTGQYLAALSRSGILPPVTA
ncbi:MAG TPA: glycosyltransferase family 4 protein [Novosphingobium sp.]|nr:glycosyltransferase family 4 protein [Novosphingobium sp.]